MTDATTQNPFAPPRAVVHDHFDGPTEMVTATRMSRFLAFLVDVSPGLIGGLVVGVMAVMMMPGLLSGHLDPKSASFATFGVFFLVLFVGAIAWTIWTIVLLYKYGQTIGKKVMGIRVVRMDGTRVSFARFFFLRGLAMAVIVWVVSIVGLAVHVHFAGNLVTLVDYLLIFGGARRCLHDYVADTKVVTAASSPNATLEGARNL
jgi:uncharacterized RDD family membrane protein YckC